MLKITINKSPISYIEIPENLENFKLYLSIEPRYGYDKAFREVRDSVEAIIRPPRAAGCFFISYQNEIELVGLKDLELTKEYRGIDDWQINKLRNKQIEHTAQIPIWKLYDHGYLSHLQIEEALTYIKKQMLSLRPEKKQQLEKNKDNKDIYETAIAITAKFSWLVRDLHDQGFYCHNLSRSLDIMDQIKYCEGNLEKEESHLVYLVLNEGALDELLKELKDIKNYKLIEPLLEFQKEIATFVRKNEAQITSIIEKTIPECALWDNKLYNDYKILKNNPGKKIEPNEYGPITNVNLPKSSLFAPDKKVRMRCEQKVHDIAQGLEISDKEMARSAFGQASHTAMKLKR